MMKYMILVAVFVGILTGCETKDNYIDTGTSKGIFDGTIYEYLVTGDPYNWDLTVKLIKRARMESYFEGKEPELEQITFFAPPSHSIRRYLLDKELESLDDLSIEECQAFLKSCIVKGRIMKKDIGFRDLTVSNEIQGGTDLQCLAGNWVKAYLEQDEWGGVAGAGAIHMSLYSITKKMGVPMATPDLQMDNGIVHALNYDFTIGNI